MKIYIDNIEVYIEDDDQYLQINDVDNANLDRIWSQIENRYSKYDKWFCYHNNTEIPNAVLDEIGAVLVDNSIETRITVSNFNNLHTLDVVRLKNNDDFKDFAIYHDQRNPEMYWTSERIRRDLSRWGIFLLKSNNHIMGYILISMWDPAQSEIYVLDAFEELQNEALIASAVKYAFDNGKSEVLYMVDENTLAQKAATEVGFITTGFYKGYKVNSSK